MFSLFPFLLSLDKMSQPRPFKPYLFVYKDKEGNLRDTEVFAKDPFQAKCLGIEQTRNDIDLDIDTSVKKKPEFDWDDDD